MATLFTKIINQEIPCHKIAETEDCLAFLDIRPVKNGHTLVIPKKEIDYFFAIDSDLMTKIMDMARDVAVAIKEVVPCKKVGMMVAGLEVPHAHIHLIPIESVSDLSFAKATPADDHDLKQLAIAISERLKLTKK